MAAEGAEGASGTGPRLRGAARVVSAVRDLGARPARPVPRRSAARSAPPESALINNEMGKEDAKEGREDTRVSPHPPSSSVVQLWNGEEAAGKDEGARAEVPGSRPAHRRSPRPPRPPRPPAPPWGRPSACPCGRQGRGRR